VEADLENHRPSTYTHANMPESMDRRLKAGCWQASQGTVLALTTLARRLRKRLPQAKAPMVKLQSWIGVDSQTSRIDTNVAYDARLPQAQMRLRRVISLDPFSRCLLRRNCYQPGNFRPANFLESSRYIRPTLFGIRCDSF